MERWLDEIQSRAHLWRGNAEPDIDERQIVKLPKSRFQMFTKLYLSS